MNSPNAYDARIIAGAAELFRTYGIRSVTMDTIAQHLGISKRTIYEKFGDKDELLFAVLTSMIAKQKEKIESILADSPNVIAAIFTLLRIGRDHAAAMNPLIGSDLKKYHSNVLQRIKKQCENPDYEGTQKILKKGIEQGLIRGDINIEIVGRGFPSIVNIMSDEAIFPPEKFMQVDLIRNIIITYLRGLSTERGLKLIGELNSTLGK